MKQKEAHHEEYSVAFSVFACLFYMITSVSITFVNKAVLSLWNFPHPPTMLLVQLTSIVVILSIARSLGYLQFEHWSEFAGETQRKLFVISILYCVNTYIALSALYWMNIPMYTCIKRFTIVLCLIGERLFLGVNFSKEIAGSVLLLTLGTILAGTNDFDFNPFGYFMAGLSCVVQAAWLVIMKKISLGNGAGKTISSTGILFYNSLLSIPFLFCFAAASGDIQQALNSEDLYNVRFLGCLYIATLFGMSLNYSQVLCNSVCGPLTFTICGQAKGIVTNFFGLFFFGSSRYDFFNALGIGINITAGCLYSYFKYTANAGASEREAERKYEA